MVAVMGAGVEFEVAAAEVKEGLRDAVDALLRRAQSVGAVRPDVTADDGDVPGGRHLPGGRARRAPRPPAICSPSSATGCAGVLSRQLRRRRSQPRGGLSPPVAE